MEAHENIDKMYCKFNDIIKDLELLRKKYSLDEKNRKILNILSKEQETKVNAMKEAKNLNSISIDSLVSTLTTYELKIKSNVQDEEEVRANRGIVLKVSQEEEDLL